MTKGKLFFRSKGMNVFCHTCYRAVRRRRRLFLYYLILIAFIGNLGTLFSWGMHIANEHLVTATDVLKSLATYTIAIAATSFADCFLAETEDDNRTLLLVLFGIMSASISTGILVLVISTVWIEQYAIIFSALAASVIWFVVKGKDPALVEADSYSTLGGVNPLATL